MKWSQSGVMLPTRIFEAATLQQCILVQCRCGHWGCFEAHGLWWHFERRHWDDRLNRAAQRFWCRRCASLTKRKVRPVKVEAIEFQQGAFELPWPEERIWKRAVARVR
ncbi:hypothetical protein [Novosphingobium sp. 9]|uniref:hypothetical protein n=1 Tax=Novosphingobium sp. 9 TaxID=2025349 RepID=UPI0021B5603D|nr:hypothetical protein [Novosphingobium sp. 9]